MKAESKASGPGGAHRFARRAVLARVARASKVDTQHSWCWQTHDAQRGHALDCAHRPDSFKPATLRDVQIAVHVRPPALATPNVLCVGAQAFGVPALRVIHPSQLRAAIRTMLDTPGPFLLDVMVPHVEHVLPMIPGGGSFRDTINEGDGSRKY